MSDKPKIYATCPAGCLWETVHKSDFEKSAAYIKQYPNEDGVYILEQGKTYLVKRTEGESEIGYWELSLPDESQIGAITYGDEWDQFDHTYKVRLLGLTLSYDEMNGEANGNLYYEINGVRYTEDVSISIDDESKFEDMKIFIVATGVTEVLLVNEHAEIRAKSAYDYACEGGYTGTEAGFGAKLAELLLSGTATVEEYDGTVVTE